MRKVVIGLFVVALSAAGISAYLFFSELSSGFPKLPNGLYVGHLDVKGEDSRTIPWMVERRPSSSDTYVTVADESFPAQRIPKALADDSALPLIVDGPSARFRLVGGEDSGGVYSGELLNPITQEKGTWTLKRVEIASLSATSESELQAWAERWNDVVVVERKIEAVQAKLAEQKAKLDKVSSFVTDGQALRQKAEVRLGETTDAVKQARSKVKELQTTLDQAIRDVELSERVSPRGRLVQLSRESIARESRWVAASLQVGAETGLPNFEKELEKAIKVKALKTEIAAERARLAEIDNAVRYGGEDSRTDDEAEFYSQLQN
jgi:hypothetical protein